MASSVYREPQGKRSGSKGARRKVTICSLRNVGLPGGGEKGSQGKGEPGSRGNCRQGVTRKRGMNPARTEAGRQAGTGAAGPFPHRVKGLIS